MGIHNVTAALLLFYGILPGNIFFVQVTDRDDNILYSWEKAVKDNNPDTLAEATWDMPAPAPEHKYKTIANGILHYDGQKVAKSGTKEIIECEKIENPSIIRLIFGGICEMIDLED